MPETYILTENYGSGSLRLYRVDSETPNTVKAFEWSPYGNSGWSHRRSTIAKSKILASYDTEEAARAAMGRAKHAWDKRGGPVGDALRRLRERESERRAAWLAALSPAEPTGEEATDGQA